MVTTKHKLKRKSMFFTNPNGNNKTRTQTHIINTSQFDFHRDTIEQHEENENEIVGDYQTL